MKSRLVAIAVLGTCSVAAVFCVVRSTCVKPTMQSSAQVFTKRTFDLSSVTFISQRQIQEHLKLYEGYVARRNEIEQSLKSINGQANNVTYTPYRSLKTAETFARNGQLLHELYFEQLEGNVQPMGDLFTRLIESSFGSSAQFLADLEAAALSSRGWVLTAYDLSDGRVHNFVLDAHNETVPVMTVPLLVTDVYEHAYFIDFGTARHNYVKAFIAAINWSVVERRVASLRL